MSKCWRKIRVVFRRAVEMSSTVQTSPVVERVSTLHSLAVARCGYTAAALSNLADKSCGTPLGGGRLLHCGISIWPMSQMGHFRRIQPVLAAGRLPLGPKSGPEAVRSYLQFWPQYRDLSRRGNRQRKLAGHAGKTCKSGTTVC